MSHATESTFDEITLLTPRDAAKRLAISERTLWTLTNDGTISAIRLGRSVRYRVADVSAALAKLGTQNDGC